MKHLIYFLLFSTAAFSQNYQYAIEVVPKKTLGSPTGLTISQVTETSVDLIWVAPVPATSIKDYEIYNKNVLLAKSTGTATNYQLKGLTSDTSYSLTVRAVDNEGNISKDSNVQDFKTLATTTGVNNQLEEIEYFKAYLLPVAQKANLQKALDTYGAVRLEKGDYRGVDIVMRSGQKLYGHLTLSWVSNITITGGSKNIVLQDLLMAESKLLFQSTGVISDCTFKSIKWASIVANNAMLENNLFINLIANFTINCSASGYFRNNKIIKNQVGGQNAFICKGNTITPSYGNVHLWLNFLNADGNSTDITDLQSATFVGIDAEGWNFNGNGTEALLKTRNIGNLRVTDFGGANGYSPIKTPAFDIEANNVFFLNEDIGSDIISKLSPNANMIDISLRHDYTRTSGTVSGFDIKAHHIGTANESNIVVNKTVQTKAISDISGLSNNILGTKYTPWARPNWENLPDPLGANWRTERVGKPDSRAYIQNLINTNKIAELPEGIYYIGSTLKISSADQGIIGSGTGKTVIVGLTDDFPLITMVSVQGFTTYYLANLTLQGGSVGQFFPENYVGSAFINTKYVVFRDQKIGLHLYKMGGTDNCFFDSISFVNCGTGLFQQPKPITDNVDMSGYIDKVVFYNGQYINCNIGAYTHGIRANNLNAWVNCKFNGNNTAASIGGSNFPIMANCDFTNNYGDSVILGNLLSLYSCNFYNNPVTVSTTKLASIFAEGCNFLDNKQLTTWQQFNNTNLYIVNSTVTGNVLVNDRPQNEYGTDNGVFLNSTLQSNPTISKMLVNMKSRVSTVIIDATPNPYPQLLVTQ